MHKILFYFILISVIFSQSNLTKFERFLVITNMDQRIEGKNGVITTSTFEGFTDKELISYKSTDIKKLYVSNSTKGPVIGLLGGIVGALIGVVYSNNKNAVIVTTFLGGAVGYMTGYQMRNWIEYPIANIPTEPTPISLSINIDL